ncbi:LysR family transcriptional regulator [Photobacterium sanctipauli]|uniref:LysR family transcriptional regulator n=1 Tax=Photobacterium sanctipauli TaxID=1342794 RepID=A0A2T3NX52_9GAMM|nr:LysR family transcriptional regulator [Photobacterium sanctipauli]PSW20778.1 LysR family transcriptional regulator [Photobacterium sanctipauli]
MYSFEQLKMFVAVCDCGSISAAARKLKRAQSGASQAISNLEISLNQTLFDRSGNMLKLTAEGSALLPIARSILLQQQRLDQKVAALEADEEHELVIAIEESLIEPALIKRLSVLAEQFPMANIEFVAGSTFDIRHWVVEGTSHVGIVYADGAMQENTEFSTLGYNRFVTVAAPTHPLAAMPAVQDNDLRNYRQLVQRSSTDKELWFSYAISTQVWYASTHQLLLDLAVEGTGWAIVPRRLAESYLKAEQLVELNVEYEPDGWITTVDVIQTRRHPSGPVRQALLQILNEAFEAYRL